MWPSLAAVARDCARPGVWRHRRASVRRPGDSRDPRRPSVETSATAIPSRSRGPAAGASRPSAPRGRPRSAPCRHARLDVQPDADSEDRRLPSDPLRALSSGPSGPMPRRAPSAPPAYRRADQRAGDGVGPNRLGGSDRLCETLSSWRLLVGGLSPGASHHSFTTSSEEPPLSNFNSYWDIPMCYLCTRFVP